jgi:hypothetical protein
MPNRTFDTNVTMSKHIEARLNTTLLEASRAGHTYEIWADGAIYDTTAGTFVDPVLIKNANGRRGLLGNL